MLTGRNARVTGSTEGIGLAIAKTMAQAGAGVFEHGIEPPEQGRRIAADFTKGSGVRTTDVQADLARADGVAAWITAAERAVEAIDTVVDYAGIRHTGAVESFPVDRGWTAQR